MTRVATGFLPAVAFVIGIAVQPFFRVLPLVIEIKEFYLVLSVPFLVAITILAIVCGKNGSPGATLLKAIPLSLCVTMVLTSFMPFVGEAFGQMTGKDDNIETLCTEWGNPA